MVVNLKEHSKKLKITKEKNLKNLIVGTILEFSILEERNPEMKLEVGNHIGPVV